MIACMAPAFLPAVASAQSRERLRVGSVSARGVVNGVGGVGLVGVSDVTRRFGTSRYEAPDMRSRPLPQANFMDSLTFQGRGAALGRTDQSLDPRIETIQDAVNTGWIRELAPGGAARFFDRSAYLEQMGRMKMGETPTPYRLLLAPEKLLSQTSFLAPVYSGGVMYARPADPLSAAETPPPAFAPLIQPAGVPRSQSNAMADYLGSRRTQRLADGWGRFKAGEYVQARSAFENAEMLDRSDPEPRVGLMLCAIAEGKFAQAGQCMKMLCRNDDGRLLYTTDFRLPERYGDGGSAKLRRDLAAMAAFVRSRAGEISAGREPGDAERFSATVSALSLALWQSGDKDMRLEAVTYAKQVREFDAGGTCAKFALGLIDTAAAPPTADAG